MPLSQMPVFPLEKIPKSDSTIWEAFQQGDKAALEHMYRQYVQDLYNYGMKIKGNEALVKDTIQELFLELWKSRTHLSSTDNIKFYLMKALKLKMYHHLKQGQESFVVSKNNLTGEVVLPYESLFIEREVQEEQFRKLSKAIRYLPDRQKEVIHLLFYEGLTYEEVSEIMGINVRSVYTLAWKSLSTLRKTIPEFLWIVILSISVAWA